MKEWIVVLYHHSAKGSHLNQIIGDIQTIDHK